MRAYTATTISLVWVLFVGVVLLGIGSLEARGSRRGHDSLSGQWLEEHAERLHLDDKTLAAIRGIVETAHAADEALRPELEQAHTRMRALLSQETPDEAAVMQQAETMSAVKLTMWKNRLRAMLQIRAQLTPEQRQELVRIRAESAAQRMDETVEACSDDLSHFCAQTTHYRARWQCLRDHAADLSETCSTFLKTRRRARRLAQ